MESVIIFGDSGDAVVAKIELASFVIKKEQTLVVRARLKRMYSEAMNMDTEPRQVELSGASDCHIPSVLLLDGRRVTFCHFFFQEFATRESRLSPPQFDTYLADFHRFHMAGCEVGTTEEEIWE